MDDWYLHRNQPGYKDKPYAIFLSHGGGGRAQKALTLFHHLGQQVGKTVISAGSPSEKNLEQCRELGRELAQK